jgi:hypothetical protein
MIHDDDDIASLSNIIQTNHQHHGAFVMTPASGDTSEFVRKALPHLP